jgi:hypothetical protein
MTAKLPKKEDILALVDASNELCAAFEAYRIGRPDPERDFVWKTLVQRKDLVWKLLGKFGY